MITTCVNPSCQVSVQPVVTDSETLHPGPCQVDQIYSLSQRSATSDSKMDFQTLEQYLADLKPDERVLVMLLPCPRACLDPHWCPGLHSRLLRALHSVALD